MNTPPDDDDVDPLEFVRAVLHISREDAAEVRRHAADKGTKADNNEGNKRAAPDAAPSG